MGLIADYKKVVSVANTNVTGKLWFTDSCVIDFGATNLSYEKVRSWVLPPQREEDVFETGHDDSSFLLDKLFDMSVSSAIFKRGKEYFFESRVTYIGISNGHGEAIPL